MEFNWQKTFSMDPRPKTDMNTVYFNRKVISQCWFELRLRLQKTSILVGQINISYLTV